MAPYGTVRRSNQFSYHSPFDNIKGVPDVKLANYRTNWKPKIKENTYIHLKLLAFSKKMLKKPVFFAFLKNSRTGKEKKSIVKASSKETDFQKMQKSSMDEYRTARMFKHENIVNVLGIVVDTVIPLLVFERGEMDLNNFAYYYDIPLLFNLKLLLDVAKGMNHLTKMGVLHNDLCGQNVVIFRNDRANDITAKLIDFDRALPQNKEGYFTDLGQLDDVPVRRMSPEALMRRGSEKSDVWEFGVMMWEIFTDGSKPFEEISDENYIGDLIINGFRLEPPPVPAAVKEFIQSCWTKPVLLRPMFSQLIYRLKFLLYCTNTFCEKINSDDTYSQWTQIFTYTVGDWMCELVISDAKRYMNLPYSVQVGTRPAHPKFSRNFFQTMSIISDQISNKEKDIYVLCSLLLASKLKKKMYLKQMRRFGQLNNMDKTIIHNGPKQYFELIMNASKLSSLMNRLTGKIWCCIVGEKFNYASMPMSVDVISLCTGSLKIFMFSQRDKQNGEFLTKEN
uniref:Protein kinase domain-containing protein n=1 Tax=Romanomermis culicivorax TaxID=13658 RepID=A0A915I3V5_ROMCU